MKQTIPQLSMNLLQLRRVLVTIVLAIGVFTLVGCGPTDPIKEIRALYAAGKFDETLVRLRELVDEDPSNAEVLFLYGEALVKTGQPGLASWPLRKAIKDPTWFIPGTLLIAKIELAGGNAENAAKAFAEILEAHPGNMNVRIQRANACANSPRLREEALAEVDRILEIDPSQLGAFKPRILAYLGLNRIEEAEQSLIDLGVRIDSDQPEDDPIRGWHCATMAIFARDSGDKKLAAERWAGCIEKYPTHPSVISQAIEFYEARGDLKRAVEIARMALDSEGSEGKGYRIRTVGLLRKLGRTDEAEILLIEGVEQSKSAVNKSASMLALAEHYKIVGNTQAAADTLSRGLRVTASFAGPQPGLLFALADLRILLGQYDEGLKLAARMTVPSHRTLVRARVAHVRKEYFKAIKLYDETSRLWPENAFAPYHGGLVALALGQVDRAFDSFLLSIRIDESVTDARFQAARMLYAQGRLKSSGEMLASTRIPPSVDAKFLWAAITARRSGRVEAFRQINKFSVKDPDRFGAAIAIVSEAFGQNGEEGEAWEIVRPLVSLELPPHNLGPILMAAMEWAPNEEQLAKLAPIVEKVIVSDAQAGLANEIRGLYYERTGANDDAIESYEKALVLEPEQTTALFRLARLIGSQDSDRAIELINKGLDQFFGPDEELKGRLLIAAIEAVGDTPGVEGVLRRALDNLPMDAQVALSLARRIEARNGEAEEVVRLATRAMRFEGGDEATALRDRAKARL